MSNSLIAFPNGITKSAIKEAGLSYAVRMSEGSNVLKETIRLRAAKAAIEAALNELEFEAIDEAERYGRHDSVIAGVEFAVRSSGTRYYYEGDPVWRELKAKIKARELLLRTITDPMVTPEGELVYPAEKRYGKESLVLTFPE